MKFRRVHLSYLYIRWVACVLLYLVCQLSVIAQLQYLIEAEGKAGTSQASFWQVNNRQGLATLKQENAYIRLGIFRNITKAEQFDFAFGLDGIKLWNYPSKYVVQQAYFDLRYRWLVLSMGSKERWGILKNHDLSSGGLSWSGNSRPIPQVSLETADFVSFPWLMHRRLQVKGGIAYGWMTDEGFVKEHKGNAVDPVLYHRKTLILQYDFHRIPWSAALGMESHALFGGDLTRFKYYMMVLIPQHGDKYSTLGDQEYSYGSTVGSWHVRLTYRQNKRRVRAYLENFFETKFTTLKQNGMDGLWGLEYSEEKEDPGLTSVALEYIQTTNQGGPFFYLMLRDLVPGPQYAAYGHDNYYIGSYNEGWSHWGMVNGNPLITSPIYGRNGVTGIFNNRVKAIHLGISGNLSREWVVKALATYTRGWGTYGSPFRNITRDYLFLLELSYSPDKLRGWSFTLSGGLDRGDLYGNNEGVGLKIRKSGIIGGQ